MVYVVKHLKIRMRHKNSDIQLTLADKITVIIGDSATGKSSLHKVLAVKDAKVTTRISDSRFGIVHLNNTSTLNGYTGGRLGDVNSDVKLLPNNVYIIDEGNVRITNEVASIIKNTINSYFIITSRTNLNNLNFDINAIKTLYTRDDGVTILKNYISMRKLDNIESMNVKYCITEDTGKAKVWFEKLFNNMLVIPAGSTNSLGDIDIKKMKYSGGKEQVCFEVEKQVKNREGNILIIFDRCSFGCCAIELKSIIDRYSDRILILSDYKCWEYVILKSNMFRKRFSEYDINIPNFEEAYYEELLYTLSSSEFSTINHTKGELSRCYTDKCCTYNRRNKDVCKLGISGNDKFVALLIGTDFEDMLRIARRMQ